VNTILAYQDIGTHKKRGMIYERMRHWSISNWGFLFPGPQKIYINPNDLGIRILIAAFHEQIKRVPVLIA